MGNIWLSERSLSGLVNFSTTLGILNGKMNFIFYIGCLALLALPPMQEYKLWYNINPKCNQNVGNTQQVMQGDTGDVPLGNELGE